MAAPDTPAETFKRALSHAARALAEQPELEVLFGTDGPRLANGVLTLPHPPRDPSAPESASLRGQADRLALRLANHDAGVNARLRPIDTAAAEVFDAVEQARVEAVVAAAGLPTRLDQAGTFAADRLLALMAGDKKAEGGALTLILARGVGQAFVAKGLDSAKVRAFLIEEGATA